MLFLLLQFHFLNIFRYVVKKNNVEWLNNNTQIHYSVKRLFTRDDEFEQRLLDQEGAYIDILRAVRTMNMK